MKQRQWQQFKANSNCQGTVYGAIYEEDKFLMLIGLYSKTSIGKNSSSKSRRMGEKQGEVDWLGTRREEKTKFFSAVQLHDQRSALWDCEMLLRLTLVSLCPYFSYLHNISCKISTSNIKLSFNPQHQIPLHRGLPVNSSSVAVNKEGDDAFFLVCGRK